MKAVVDAIKELCSADNILSIDAESESSSRQRVFVFSVKDKDSKPVPIADLYQYLKSLSAKLKDNLNKFISDGMLNWPEEKDIFLALMFRFIGVKVESQQYYRQQYDAFKAGMLLCSRELSFNNSYDLYSKIQQRKDPSVLDSLNPFNWFNGEETDSILKFD